MIGVTRPLVLLLLLALPWWWWRRARLQPAAAVVVGKAPGPPVLPQPASRARVSVASAAARITAPA